MRGNELISLKSPISVNLELTPVCNLSCVMCFTSSCSNLKHPSLDQLKAIVDELHRAEVFEIRLFGGEFLTYPYWREILAYIKARDFFISFVSNGTLITTETAKELYQNGISGGAISLHGPKRIHESITRSKNSFERVIKGIRNCFKENISVSILYTLTRENLDSIFETMDLLKTKYDLPIQEFNLGRLCPYGNAKHEWDNKKLSLNDYLSTFPVLKKIREEFHIQASMGDAFPMCLIPEEYQEYVIGCWQGTGFGHIDSGGNVKSCSIIAGSYGNLLTTPLTEIWTKNLEKFRSLDWLPEKCQTCENFCGGGCSASRLGSALYAPDEFLEY